MRCPTCDSRYCGTICYADDLRYAYVVGRGFQPWLSAGAYYANGWTVEFKATDVTTRRVRGVRSSLDKPVAAYA